jgi:hypothetical protein
MVRHHTVRIKFNGGPENGLSQYALERFVVLVNVEKLGTFCSPVEDVKDESRRRRSSPPWHRTRAEARAMPSEHRDYSVLNK